MPSATFAGQFTLSGSFSGVVGPPVIPHVVAGGGSTIVIPPGNNFNYIWYWDAWRICALQQLVSDTQFTAAMYASPDNGTLWNVIDPADAPSATGPSGSLNPFNSIVFDSRFNAPGGLDPDLNDTIICSYSTIASTTTITLRNFTFNLLVGAWGMDYAAIDLGVLADTWWLTSLPNGNIVLVYQTGSPGTATTLSWILWNGSAWSSPTPIDDTADLPAGRAGEPYGAYILADDDNNTDIIFWDAGIFYPTISEPRIFAVQISPAGAINPVYGTTHDYADLTRTFAAAGLGFEFPIFNTGFGGYASIWNNQIRMSYIRGADPSISPTNIGTINVGPVSPWIPVGYYEATAYSITAGQNYSFSSMDFGPYGEYWGQTNNQFYRVFKNFGVWDAAPSLLWDATAEPPYAYGNPTPLAGTVFGWCVVNQNPRLGGYNLTALFEGSSGVYVADLLVQGPSAPPAAPPANYGWTG